MPYDIAGDFINAFLAGQQHRDQLQIRGHRERQMQMQEEDQLIEKDLLQHRLREMKINEKIRARDMARENVGLMQGTPTRDLTPEMTEGGTLPATSPTSPNSIITQMKQMQIPGVEELGVPGVPVRPQTHEQGLQDTLAKLTAEARIKSLFTEYNLAPGAVRMQGGRKVAENPKEEERVWVNTRDKKGKTIRRYVTKTEAAENDWEQEPIPRSGGTTVVLPPSELNSIADGVAAGTLPISFLNGLRGQDKARLGSMLVTRGFNATRAEQDQKAIITNLQTVNGAGLSNLRVAADTATAALADLEEINNRWDRKTFGPLTGASIAITKAKGGESGAMAKEAEDAVNEVRSAIAILKSGGSAATNTALANAEKLLSATQGQTDLAATILRLKTHIGYRTGAIRGLEAITTDRGATETGGGTDTPAPKAPTAAEVAAALKAGGRASDSATVKKVMASPAAMQALFGQ